MLPPEDPSLSRELLRCGQPGQGHHLVGSPDSLLQSIAQRPASFSGVANLMGRGFRG